ncbi:hypothetical protein M011DRAFT_456009 [Sporormia fimetaria CBS 119925]|uniref:Uncharacterized protein n=1 Tax=Sporormia fimetaria CBS 119925 TaxID=1340428 RepID=A0A6A6VLN7_9PLEO|nr:hypothetical protein M011DRAFT_456009 [Sporormia fimetaria CBS 119925]
MRSVDCWEGEFDLWLSGLSSALARSPDGFKTWLAARNGYVERTLDQEDKEGRDLCAKVFSALPLELRDEIYSYLITGNVLEFRWWLSTVAKIVLLSSRKVPL